MGRATRGGQPRYQVRPVDERHLDRHDRRRLGGLLAEAFGDEEVRRDAHYGDPPLVRVVARHHGTPVAQAGLSRLHATPPRYRVFGIGDVAVHPDHRGRGLARRVVEQALEIAATRRPDLIVTRTDPLQALFRRHGFVPIGPEAMPALDAYENWLVWSRTPVIPEIDALDPSDV